MVDRSKWNRHRYLVSVQGESQWARNLRAAGTAQLPVGTSSQSPRTSEKTAFVGWYCRQPEHRLSVRYGLKADPRT